MIHCFVIVFLFACLFFFHVYIGIHISGCNCASNIFFVIENRSRIENGIIKGKSDRFLLKWILTTE